MARGEAPPFARGETFYNGSAIDTANLGGRNLEGKEFDFEVNSDVDAQDFTGRPIRVKVVRNKSSIALKPKRVVKYYLNSAQPLGTAVDGYTFAADDPAAGVVDEYLPAAGVPVNDLFYVVIEGPTTCITVDSGLTTLAIGDIVVPGTGTSAVTADSGKINKQSLAGATTVLGGQIQGRLGRSSVANAVATTDTKVVLQRHA